MGLLQVGDAQVFAARLGDLVDVYREAFLEVYEDDPAQATRDREHLMRQHIRRSGLRLVTAESADGRVAGFCYTYRGAPGQWWHDVVLRALARADADRWLANCREVVELHVRPDAQGHGLGRDLLRAALDDTPERTTALSALDIPDTRAQRLYASEGFAPLLTGFAFPGSRTRYAILAKDLDRANS